MCCGKAADLAGDVLVHTEVSTGSDSDRVVWYARQRQN